MHKTRVSAGVVSCALTYQCRLLTRRIIHTLSGRIIMDSMRSIRVIIFPLAVSVVTATRMLNECAINSHYERVL